MWWLLMEAENGNGLYMFLNWWNLNFILNWVLVLNSSFAETSFIFSPIIISLEYFLSKFKKTDVFIVISNWIFI